MLRIRTPRSRFTQIPTQNLRFSVGSSLSRFCATEFILFQAAKGQCYAQIMEVVQCRHRFYWVLHQRTFCYFQSDALRVVAPVAKNAGYAIGQRRPLVRRSIAQGIAA